MNLNHAKKTYINYYYIQVFKYIDLRKNPSLEFGMMLVFIYAPYGLAEGLHLSGNFHSPCHYICEI